MHGLTVSSDWFNDEDGEEFAEHRYTQLKKFSGETFFKRFGHVVLHR